MVPAPPTQQFGRQGLNQFRVVTFSVRFQYGFCGGGGPLVRFYERFWRNCLGVWGGGGQKIKRDGGQKIVGC